MVVGCFAVRGWAAHPGRGCAGQGFFKPTIIRLMSDLTGGRDKCVRQMKVRCPGGGGTWWGGCLTCVVAQVTNIRCPRRFGAVCAKCHTLDDVCPILDFTGRTYAELVTYACSVLYVTPLGLYVGGSVPVVTSGSAANTARVPAPGTGCGKGISATWCVVAWHRSETLLPPTLTDGLHVRVCAIGVQPTSPC